LSTSAPPTAWPACVKKRNACRHRATRGWRDIHRYRTEKPAPQRKIAHGMKRQEKRQYSGTRDDLPTTHASPTTFAFGRPAFLGNN
jgi:hypothetical protein